MILILFKILISLYLFYFLFHFEIFLFLFFKFLILSPMFLPVIFLVFSFIFLALVTASLADFLSKLVVCGRFVLFPNADQWILCGCSFKAVFLMKAPPIAWNRKRHTYHLRRHPLRTNSWQFPRLKYDRIPRRETAHNGT